MPAPDLRDTFGAGPYVDVEAALTAVHARARQHRARRTRLLTAAAVLVLAGAEALMLGRSGPGEGDHVLANGTGEVPLVTLSESPPGLELVAVDDFGTTADDASRWGDPGIYVLTYREPGLLGPPLVTVSIAGTHGMPPPGTEAATVGGLAADVWEDDDRILVVRDLDEVHSVRVETWGLDRDTALQIARSVHVVERRLFETMVSEASHAPPYGFIDGYDVVLAGDRWEVRAGQYRKAFLWPMTCVQVHGRSEAPLCPDELGAGGATAALERTGVTGGSLLWGVAPFSTSRAVIESSAGATEITLDGTPHPTGALHPVGGMIVIAALTESADPVQVTFLDGDGAVLAVEVL